MRGIQGQNLPNALSGLLEEIGEAAGLGTQIPDSKSRGQGGDM